MTCIVENLSHSSDHHPDDSSNTSETSVNFRQTTWHNNPEQKTATHRRENLKSHKKQFCLTNFRFSKITSIS